MCLCCASRSQPHRILLYYCVHSCSYKRQILMLLVLVSVYTPFHEDGDISQARKAGEAIANAFIVIGVVLVLTIVLVLLYKFRCYCVSISIIFLLCKNSWQASSLRHVRVYVKLYQIITIFVLWIIMIQCSYK